jgi:hypothetical protein
MADEASATLPSRSAPRRSTAASAPSSNNPPYLVSVNATLLCPAHFETSRTLQPAATMMATKLCRIPWKMIGQRDFDFSLATLGIHQTHRGFAVLLSALVAIAHPVSGDDSKAARAVTPLNGTPLNGSHTPIPVGI